MSWQHCKNILCIRPDNMGDLIMSGPAIRALKETFNAKITVLTSSAAAGIVINLPEIDEVIVSDLPWVKNQSDDTNIAFFNIIEDIKKREFDGAVIFTVYSQNPLPTVMLAYLAGIPNRLAYCRENPYRLLSDWLPDKEPYSFIKHQVQRDLDLVAIVGAFTKNDHLNLNSDRNIWSTVRHKLETLGVDTAKSWIILHAGVSEVKREYPSKNWIEIGKQIINELGYQVIYTGSEAEKQLTGYLQGNTGKGSFSAGGIFNLDEFIVLIAKAPFIISVNTGTVHIAAALQIPVVVLYAMTNPQHTPWKSPNKVLPFSVPESMQSKNEIVRYVNERLIIEPIKLPSVEDILNALQELVGNSISV